MEVLSVKELSNYLKISISTIRRMIFKGEIPYFTLSKQYFFKKEIIDNWIDSQIDLNYQRKEI